jgi:hypothetical protein
MHEMGRGPLHDDVSSRINLGSDSYRAYPAWRCAPRLTMALGGLEANSGEVLAGGAKRPGGKRRTGMASANLQRSVIWAPSRAILLGRGSWHRGCSWCGGRPRDFQFPTAEVILDPGSGEL